MHTVPWALVPAAPSLVLPWLCSRAGASHTAFPRSAFGGTVASHRSFAPPLQPHPQPGHSAQRAFFNAFPQEPSLCSRAVLGEVDSNGCLERRAQLLELVELHQAAL
eukprot:scaffold89972_cov71-Phaeocystis_antarctica.AAC.2